MIETKSTMLHFELEDSHPYQPSVQAKEHCNE